MMSHQACQIRVKKPEAYLRWVGGILWSLDNNKTKI